MGPSRMQLSKPVIAAIEGHAVAGGLELALWADLRVAAEDAVLGVFCRRWGVPLIDGGTVRLPRLIGQSRAMDLVLTGRPVDAAEAHAIGLVNRLCRPGAALETAVELAREIAALPQTCLRHDRLSLLEQWGLVEGEAMAVELAHGVVSLQSDALAGADAVHAGGWQARSIGGGSLVTAGAATASRPDVSCFRTRKTPRLHDGEPWPRESRPGGIDDLRSSVSGAALGRNDVAQ